MSWNDLRKGRCSLSNSEYFITFTTYQRHPLFLNHEAATCFSRQLAISERNTDSNWLAWVLMPDHFHGLLKLNNEASLAEVVKDIKGRSAFVLNKQFHLQGKCWQPAYYDRALRRAQDRRAIARYIIANPLRAKLVSSIGDYPYWNAVYI